jgi:1-hydroxy-2-methyl-2-(E)-butenyl 4-diphosphate synthase
LTEQALCEQGAEILYQSSVCGVYLEDNTVIGLRVLTGSGIVEYGTKIVLDCTAEAYIAAMAGCETEIGRETDGQTQPYSLVTMVFDGEKYGFTNIKAAVKSSDIAITLKAYRKIAQMGDWPLHLGLTEAGTSEKGMLRSAIAVGSLLTDGIGDTIRISLTAAPEDEIAAAKRILDACGLLGNSVEIISCPTCGRTEIDLIALVHKVEAIVAELKADNRELLWKKIAVMGCPVNGPGEARNADIGIAGSRNGQLIIFRKGEVLGAYSESEAFERFASLLSAGK